MGTTPRKKTPKKKTKASDDIVVVANGFGNQPSELTTLAEDLTNLVGRYKKALAKIPTEQAFPQSAMKAALALKELEKQAKQGHTAFNNAALHHHEEKGAFQAGNISIAFTTSGKRSPQWKTEATDQAAQADGLKKAIGKVLNESKADDVLEVAHNLSLEFDQENYQKRVLDATTPSDSTSVKLTENA